MTEKDGLSLLDDNRSFIRTISDTNDKYREGKRILKQHFKEVSVNNAGGGGGKKGKSNSISQRLYHSDEDEEEHGLSCY